MSLSAEQIEGLSNGFADAVERASAATVMVLARRRMPSTGIVYAADLVVTASHALSGIERSVAARHSGVYPLLLIADTLKLLGQGTKVAVEVAVMAADAGVLSGQDIVSIGGSGRGADTALVLKPAHQNNFFEMRIREVICKPREF